MKKKLIFLITLLALTGCGGAPLSEAPSAGQSASAAKQIPSGQDVLTVNNKESVLSTEEETESKAEIPETETEIPETETETEKDPHPFAEPIRGIYVSAWVAGVTDRMDEIIAAIDQTELNTVVIDVKDDEGRVVWDVSSPMIDETEAVRVAISDMPSLIEKLHDHGIYVIGRLVAFRDGYIGDVRPDWVFHNPDGSVYRDEKNFAWIDPTNEEATNYLFEVADACKDVGFDEIQFDYVRYPTKVTEEMVGADGPGRQNNITAFASRAKEHFLALNMPYSMDVFGIVIHAEYDRNIVGQNYAELSFETDALSPMVYPSHYADGTYEQDYPDLHPYEIIYASMTESKELLEEAKKTRPDDQQAIVRPWIQGFTANYLSHYINYGAEEIRTQIQAVYDAGYEEWLVWDPSEGYPWDAFEPAE